jgi:3-methylcrotonyl-CoA carboxylase alpha subunit
LKILIANRGEIACRVIRTARRMGLATVAVYSDADRNALHVTMADQAVPIGAAPARDSYLAADRIVQAALDTGAQAIHPGYGFLSENAAFAEACARAGLVFIGPPAAAIRAMGSKAAAKALMERAGVPLVPGYHGEAQDVATFQTAAAAIGYPVLLKASAGGGGKGMRVVADEGALAAAIDGARHESQAAFGNDRLLIEKYLTRPRHIEIQVFADGHGHCVSLFERDCSIQRRHQKVLEESPAPFMDPARRQTMGEAAIAAARAVDYVGAGTVEFIAEGGQFYFMEMNTRLQVEHPVTEMVTGLDLVEWQIRVARGEALPPPPDAPRGHAIEARIYAEDPARDFLPSIGQLIHLRMPHPRSGVRVDTGVREGDRITPYYDPMIAKLIVHAQDRAGAVRKLTAALETCEIVGVRSNLALLRAIAGHAAYAEGEIDTGFIPRHPAVLADGIDAECETVALAAVVLDTLAARRGAAQAGDPYSPWDEPDSWRLNGEAAQSLHVELGGQPAVVRIVAEGAATRFSVGGVSHTAERLEGHAIRVDGAMHRPRIVAHGESRTVVLRGRNATIRLIDPLAPPRAAEAVAGSLAAPIPARVTRILAGVGDSVAKGAVLLTLEAMKMELTIAAPFAGIVREIRHVAGDMVEEGTVLAVLGLADPA